LRFPPTLDPEDTYSGQVSDDYLGRRKLLLFGSWMVNGCLVIICVCELLKDHHVFNGTAIQVALLSAVCVHVVVKSICISGKNAPGSHALIRFISGVAFVLPYELFPTPVRAAVASYVCGVGVDLGDLFLLFAYLPTKQAIGGYR
jgi:hypothetical protein